MPRQISSSVYSAPVKEVRQLDIFAHTGSNTDKDKFMEWLPKFLSNEGNVNLNYTFFACWNGFKYVTGIELDKSMMSIWITELCILGIIRKEYDSMLDEDRYYSFHRWMKR